jgi:hypothetical protein
MLNGLTGTLLFLHHSSANLVTLIRFEKSKFAVIRLSLLDKFCSEQHL